MAQDVLFIDDDVSSTSALIRALERRNAPFSCHASSSRESALEAVKRLRPPAAVLDLSLDSTGPLGGLSLLEELLSADSTLRVLILTGHDTEEHGIQALQRGAASFLSKPVDAEHLLAVLRDAVAHAELQRSYLRLKRGGDDGALTSRSPRMIQVLDSVRYAASTNQSLLLVGETGTGKGVIAQEVHRLSAGHTRAFVRFAPAFTSGDLVTSELFGHQRGAFTGAVSERRGVLEEADGGTLFIDEVDELPQETQVVLLNALQEKVFRRVGSNKNLRSHFRLISATNRPLDTLVPERLREDFYHRIAHIVIEVPPLRDRREDIDELAEGFFRALVLREKLSLAGLLPEAREKLGRYPWPGNVRELQAVVEGAAYRARYEGKRFIAPEHVVLKAKRGSAVSSLRSRVREFEASLVADALKQSNNNQTRAARLLGIDRSVLRRLIARNR
jgi:two-component system, NtrC family, response regulator